MFVKKPPARILPSAWSVMERTVLLAFGLNESARPLMGSSRAIRLRVWPPMLPETATHHDLTVCLQSDGVDKIV